MIDNGTRLQLYMAMNYIPAEFIIGTTNHNERPLVMWLEGKEWVLKDKHLKTAHYERAKDEVDR